MMKMFSNRNIFLFDSSNNQGVSYFFCVCRPDLQAQIETVIDELGRASAKVSLFRGCRVFEGCMICSSSV